MTGRRATMRAAVYRAPGVIEPADVDRPDPEDGDAVVAVEYCGICGTDLHMVVDGWGTPGAVLGHEWSGRVVEPGATGLAPGTLVVGLPVPPCGACRPCHEGRPSLCRGRPAAGGLDRGAFAEYVAAPATRLQPVPPDVDARTAAYAEPLAVALHAVTLAGITADASALVSGAGPIGAAIIALLVERGVTTTAVEPGASRSALAERLGAAVEAPEDLEITPHPGDTPAAAVDVVFETSGVRAAEEAALAQLRPGGLLVLVGTGLDFPRFDTNRIILNELRITGAFNYDAHGFDDALALLAAGRLPVDDLLSPDDVALDDLGEAMRRLRAGDIPGKALVRPHDRR